MELSKSAWHFKLLSQLKERNKTEHVEWKKLINSQTQLLQKIESLELENTKLSTDNLALRTSQSIVSQSTFLGSDNQNVQQLERKLFSLQEELTDIHRQKSDNAQQMLEVSRLIQEKEKFVATIENKLAFSESELFITKEELATTKERLKKSESDYQFVLDEFNALNLLYESLEKKYTEGQTELKDVIARWMIFKAQDADRMNAENEAGNKKIQDDMQRKILEASQQSKSINEAAKFASESPYCLISRIPTKPFCYKHVHDGHINVLKHTQSGVLLASGGADHKIKMWRVDREDLVKDSTFLGANAAITSIDFNSTESFILASSNDFASYIWTIADKRVRSTLTGHTGKVMAAKFLPDDSFIISGSYDRTLKLWDVQNTKCVRTLFPGSSCNDIVVTHSQWHTIISGHFDKKIRLYDTRSDSSTPKDISVCQGKITSLSLSRDGNSLLCSGRDDTLKLVDLRTNQVSQSYSADGFHIGADYVRACFSPDEAYVACGSNAGDILIWNTASGHLESTLCEDRDCVLDCSWNPNGKTLYTASKNRTITCWSCS